MNFLKRQAKQGHACKGWLDLCSLLPSSLHLPCISKDTYSWFKHLSVGEQSMDIIYSSLSEKNKNFPLQTWWGQAGESQASGKLWGGNVAVADQLSSHCSGWYLFSLTLLSGNQPHSRNGASGGMPPTNPGHHATEASEAAGGKGETLWPGWVGLGNWSSHQKNKHPNTALSQLSFAPKQPFQSRGQCQHCYGRWKTSRGVSKGHGDWMGEFPLHLPLSSQWLPEWMHTPMRSIVSR